LGAQKQVPYLSLHPFAKIPAIVDDGFALYETQAILRHRRPACGPAFFDRRHAEPDTLSLTR
jgi:hypothetical protein